MKRGGNTAQTALRQRRKDFEMKHLFTSESVTEGHPDKVCDQISDAILDAYLAEDPFSRVACEVTATTGIVCIMGEITSSAHVDMEQIARETLRRIGYTSDAAGFNCDTCAVVTSVHRQSPDIALGVDMSLESKEGDALGGGAGDQGLMFGYATDETPEYMPLAISLAHRTAKRLADVRKSGELPYLLPDGKTQYTVIYEDNKVVGIDTIVLSTQHTPDVSLETIRRDMIERVIAPSVPEGMLTDGVKIYVNPTGRFVIGGPAGDSGLTGRKIIVDTYGGASRHGGGAFSGKDPTKVDRSASYAARYVAKNIVAAGLASRAEVQIAYAIGVAHPVSVMIDTFGTQKCDLSRLTDAVTRLVDLRPDAIIERFELRRPIYSPLAAYGHMGREELGVKWESVDLASELRAAAL